MFFFLIVRKITNDPEINFTVVFTIVHKYVVLNKCNESSEVKFSFLQKSYIGLFHK